jgi:hypothetical protein
VDESNKRGDMEERIMKQGGGKREEGNKEWRMERSLEEMGGKEWLRGLWTKGMEEEEWRR